MSYHFTPMKRLKPKGLKMPSVGKELEQQKPSYTAGGSVNSYSHVGEKFNSF